jgi:hypothetical protein
LHPSTCILHFSVCSNHSYFYQPGLSKKDSKSGEIAKTFIDAAVYFYGKAEFAILDQSAARNISRSQNIELSSIFVYSHRIILGSYRFPKSITQFLYLLNQIIETLPEPIANLSKLYCTVLSPQNLSRRAMSLQYRAAEQMGQLMWFQ